MHPDHYSSDHSETGDNRPKIDVVRPTPLRIGHQPSSWQGLKPVAGVASFVIGVLVVATAINAFVFQSYYVEGTSMAPTLGDNDRLIIEKTGHSFARLKGQPYVPERGSIIVLNSSLPDPNSPGGYEQLIKRVVGLPGERVVVSDGVITIFNDLNPEGINPDTLEGLRLEPTFTSERIDVRLGSDEVFVTGDNRGPGGSLDSRTFGPVDVRDIEGRLWARLFPDARIF